MKEGAEKNEILNPISEEVFQKAIDKLNFFQEKGIIDIALYDLIIADLGESYDKKQSNPQESLGLLKKAMNRIEIAAENKGIKINVSDVFSDIPDKIVENTNLIDHEKQRYSEFAKVLESAPVSKDKEEENIFSDLESGQEDKSSETEIEESPESEVEIFESGKNKEEESVESEENNLFSVFESSEKKLGALNASVVEKQEIQTYLDAATDAILENNKEDANVFLAMAEEEIAKFSVVHEEIGLKEEIEDTIEEEEDFESGGVPLTYPDYSEEGIPEVEKIKEIAEIKIEEPKIRADEIKDNKKKEEESLKFKEYKTAIGFVNSKFLDFFDQEKYINSEEKEKVALLLECAYDALKEAEVAENEEEKIRRYEEALESANMASDRMDKVLKESGEKELGKTRFAQIVRLSKIQKAERRKYFNLKKDEDKIKIRKKRSRIEDILGKAGILTVDEEDEFSRKKVIMTPAIKEAAEKIERYEKEAVPAYETLAENENFYSVSEDDFEEFKRLAFSIIKENQNIVDLTNKEEEKEWENMASNKKIAEENASSVDIKETGENIFYSGKDAKAIKYLEKNKGPKLPSTFKNAYEKAEHEQDEQPVKKAKKQSPLNGSTTLLEKDKSKSQNNIIITDENTKNFE